jgi:hypothetical protein
LREYFSAGFRRTCLSRGLHLYLPMCGIVHLPAPFGPSVRGNYEKPDFYITLGILEDNVDVSRFDDPNWR